MKVRTVGKVCEFSNNTDLKICFADDGDLMIWRVDDEQSIAVIPQGDAEAFAELLLELVKAAQ